MFRLIGFLEDLLTLGYLGVFVFSLVINLIPFLSPSNLIISGAVGSLFPQLNLFMIGLLAALGASTAKTIHFGVSFFAGSVLGKRKMETLKDSSGGKDRPAFLKLGAIALFVAAVSPVPDDPVVIPLGLMRYSPLKFFLSYFAGKLIVTTAGAYLGQSLGLTIEEYLGETAAIAISIVLTVLVTVILLKWKIILKKMNGLHLPGWIARP